VANIIFKIHGFLVLISLLLINQPAYAAEYLANNSFELPVAPANGNNFYTTIPGWTLVPSPAVGTPANIVVPTAAYANNPSSTPGGGGLQYFDMNSAGGIVKQTVTLPTSGKVSISTWFSVRDFPQNLSGFSVSLKNSSGTVVATATGSFTTADAIGLWKKVSVSNVTVPAGNYTFEILMDNYNNIDIASLDYVADAPQLQITKTADKSTPVSVGDVITYTFIAKNVGNVPLTNVTVADTHNGFGTPPVAGNETVFTDVAPLNDSFDTTANDGIWNSLQVGDSIKFTGTYIVVQQDINLLQ
jgi:hypothetical protein